MKFTITTSLFILAAVVVKALPLEKRGTGAAIEVKSELNFCSYLPPGPGLSVSVTEKDGEAYCTTARDYASAFPEGFIQSAHFASTPRYAQITGRIDHNAYNISTVDGGGQYDVKNLPDGTCNGMEHWVNLIEPDSDTFCIRCCQDKADCNIGISTRGCERIVPGNYS